MVPSTASLPASQPKVPPSRRGNTNTNHYTANNTNATSNNTVTSTATASTVTTTLSASTGMTTCKHTTALTGTGAITGITTTATATPRRASNNRSSGCWTHHDDKNNSISNSSKNSNNTATTTTSGSSNNNDPKMMVTATTAPTSNNCNSSRNMMMISRTNNNDNHPNHHRSHNRHLQHHRHRIQDIMEQDDSDVDDDDEYDENEEEEIEEEEHNIRLCLHCKSEKTNKADIQVRCDECTAFICDDCHWCHEYQANHEIRVCDRCDGFYCRHCDEMDQCDDCHEVVCTSCSTLLSCKFCGGGLCEDCATACGRCGIVLCSRDSKFAVECDTCRLSYCLVCLASGSKDACVRCGSRPSKRMEQLVHLRLKSIYKAFKQNASSPSCYHVNGKYSNPSSSRGGSGRHHPQRLNDEFDFGDPDDPDALFQAVKISEAAAASSMYSNTHKNSSYNGTNNITEKPSSSSRSASSTSTSTVDRATRFKEEKERADAAAAALLAELEEEEEENVKSKSKKKKKKKSKQVSSLPKNESDNVQNNISIEGDMPTASVDVDDDDDDDGSSVEYISNLVLAKGDHMDRKPAAKYDHDKRDNGNSKEHQNDEVMEDADQLEKDLCKLVAAEDIDGLETLMEAIKGIPGRAALRKNAKKALKKLRLASSPLQDNDDHSALPMQNIPVKAMVMQQSPRPTARVLTPEIPVAQSDPNGYLQIISHVHNKPASQCATPGSQHVNGAQSRSRSNSLANANGPLKSECMMYVRPLIVGWMIGKGGQRIRDLMEESGARIWIDQDSMRPSDPRILYISGSRKNVDMAIGLLQDLVVKYQPLPSPHTRQSTTPMSEKVIATIPAAGKGPGIPESSDLPALPLKRKVGPIVPSSDSIVNVSSDSRSRQVLSCDPRFVPLLIGRRGWTIKNIQDSTGAKVDIDQNSTPRKITISGLDDNVDKAVRMVQDVLSYPHSQLHGVIEDLAYNNDKDVVPPDDDENAELQKVEVVQDVSPMQCEPYISTPSVEVASDIPTPQPVNVTATKVPGHSPPSSLIMTGDAKSTISASSSLSSTPEPVLPSGSHAQIPHIDLGPTTYPLPQSREVFSTVGALQQGSFNQINPLSPLPHPSIFHSQSGHCFFDSLDQSYQQIPPENQQHALNTPISLHQYSPNQLNRPTFLPDQSSAFLSVHGPAQMPMLHPMVAPPSQNLFGIGTLQGHTNLHDTVRQNDHPLSAVGSDFWNGIGASQQPPPIRNDVNPMTNDGFQLHAAAVDFLEHSKQLHAKPPNSSAGDINDVLGLSIPSPAGLERPLTTTQGPLHHFPRGRDDALMIDSLFGPSSTNETSSAVTDNLLSSLNVLSLRPEEASSGLWGNPDPLVNTSELPELDDSKLFGGLAQQKSESRFIWGETGNF